MNALKLALPLLCSATLLAGTARADGVTETRPVKDFHKIALNGSVDLEVTEGADYHVEVIAPEKVIKDIETKVDDGTLQIGMKHHFGFHISWSSGKTLVRVSLPELDAVSVNGSGDVKATGLKGGHDFEVAVRGSGDVSVSGSAKGVNVGISGSGDVHFDSGTASALQVRINGSGDVDARALQVRDADVSTHGSGDVSLTLTGGNARLETAGSGDIDWWGSATVNSSSHGSGDITHHGGDK